MDSLMIVVKTCRRRVILMHHQQASDERKKEFQSAPYPNRTSALSITSATPGNLLVLDKRGRGKRIIVTNLTTWPKGPAFLMIAEN